MRARFHLAVMMALGLSACATVPTASNSYVDGSLTVGDASVKRT
jgi:starvation-inducible outer membrane lipoprotein